MSASSEACSCGIFYDQKTVSFIKKVFSKNTIPLNVATRMIQSLDQRLLVCSKFSSLVWPLRVVEDSLMMIKMETYLRAGAWREKVQYRGSHGLEFRESNCHIDEFNKAIDYRKHSYDDYLNML